MGGYQEKAKTADPKHRRRGWGITRKVAMVLLTAAIAVTGCIVSAYAASGTKVTIGKGDSISYGDTYNTHWYTGTTENGSSSYIYCAEPDMASPTDGCTGTASEIDPEENSNGTSHSAEYIAAILWFGYGGPGFDEDMWPDEYYDGSKMTDEDYYAVTHVLLAASYSSSKSSGLYGTSSDFKSWYNEYIAYGSSYDDDTLGNQIAERMDEVPESFIDSCYQIDTGEGTQIMLGYDWSEIYVTFSKTSANTSITSGNDYYSLEGTTYYIYTADDDEFVAEVVFENDGDSGDSSTTLYETISLQPDTKYYAVEKESGEGYATDSSKITFTTGSSDYSEDTWTDTAKTVDVKIVKESGDEDITGGNEYYSLEGAVFTLTDENGDEHTATTDENGECSFTDIPLGTYTIVETTAPTGFALNEDWSVTNTVGSDDVSGETIEFDYECVDAPITLKLVIYKVDSCTDGEAQANCSLAGAVFTLVDSNDVSHTATTDENGKCTFEDIPLGDYTISETTALQGYKLSSDTASGILTQDMVDETGTITLDNIIYDDEEITVEYTFPNDVISFDIEIWKYEDHNEGLDEEVSNLLDPLEGVTFEIYRVDEEGADDITDSSATTLVGSITTDADGYATTADAAYVNEEAVSEEVTYDSSKPWMGEGKRNANISGALPYNEYGYIIHEVWETVPEGVDTVEDWTVTCSEDGETVILDGATYTYVAENVPDKDHVQIVKVDVETGNVIPAAGFEFELYDSDYNLITMTTYYPNETELSSFTTDETGCVTFPQALEYGTYYIKEISAASPYLVVSDYIEFTVDGSEDVDTVIAVSEDPQALGQATITKYDAETGETIEGTVFNVVAMEDIVSPDGTVRYNEGDVVGTVTTGEDGTATYPETVVYPGTDEAQAILDAGGEIENQLYLGDGEATYAFVEVDNTDGYELDSTPVEFTLTYVDDETEVVYADVEMYDEPTTFTLNKVAGDSENASGTALAGATFAWWSVDDEVDASDGIAVRAGSDDTVTVTTDASYAEIDFELPSDVSAVLTSTDGIEITIGESCEGYQIEPGDYVVTFVDENGEETEWDSYDATFEASKSYTVSSLAMSWTSEADPTDHVSYSIEVEENGSIVESVDCTYDEDQQVWIADGGDLEADTTYTVTVTLADDGSAVSTEVSYSGASIYLELEAADSESTDDADEDSSASGYVLSEVVMLLADGSELETATTGDDGTFTLSYLEEGTYRLAETDAPEGYVVNSTVYEITVDEDGIVEEDGLTVEDNPTKVYISKIDITDGEELEGAELTVIDEDGNVVDSWTSTDEAHYIEALPAGTYTLVETLTPHNYDEAESIEFTVTEDGEVVTVEMEDEPIEISCEIDKKQEIADPTAEDTEANGDGENTAETSISDDGTYDYTLDYRSTSNTWADEFTVTDYLECAEDGLAYLTGITTAQAWEDYDGLMNVWYQTNLTDEDYVDDSGANATLSDGHENSWLENDDVVAAIGDDARVLDYTGWELWEADVSTTEATYLSVDDLDLEDGEYVTAIRFEYGRVEEGFTTRVEGWDSDTLKDEHDDVDDAADANANDSFDEGDYASAVIHMQVTDSYTEDSYLANYAEVDIYRNGGNIYDDDEGLEDHDDDRVEQTPSTIIETVTSNLAQTGIPPYVFILAAAGALALIAWAGMRRHDAKLAKAAAAAAADRSDELDMFGYSETVSFGDDDESDFWDYDDYDIG